VLFLSLYNAWAIAVFLPVSDFGLPPFLPLALAACNPACVRSIKMSLSISAKALIHFTHHEPYSAIVTVDGLGRFGEA
jgi:hypothetical protein